MNSIGEISIFICSLIKAGILFSFKLIKDINWSTIKWSSKEEFASLKASLKLCSCETEYPWIKASGVTNVKASSQDQKSCHCFYVMAQEMHLPVPNLKQISQFGLKLDKEILRMGIIFQKRMSFYSLYKY